MPTLDTTEPPALNLLKPNLAAGLPSATQELIINCDASNSDKGEASQLIMWTMRREHAEQMAALEKRMAETQKAQEEAPRAARARPKGGAAVLRGGGEPGKAKLTGPPFCLTLMPPPPHEILRAQCARVAPLQLLWRHLMH